MKKTIAVKLIGNQWHAEILSPQCDVDECQELFGTATLPTPWTARATFTEVKAGLIAANLDRETEIIYEEWPNPYASQNCAPKPMRIKI